MPIISLDWTKSVFGWVLVCQPRHTPNVIGFINTISSRNRWLQVFQAYRPKIKQPGFVNNIIVSTRYVHRTSERKKFVSAFYTVNCGHGWWGCTTVFFALAQSSGRWVIFYFINTPTTDDQVHLQFFSLDTFSFFFRFSHKAFAFLFDLYSVFKTFCVT